MSKDNFLLYFTVECDNVSLGYRLNANYPVKCMYGCITSWYAYNFRTRMVVGVGSRHIGGSFVEIMEQNGWRGLWVGNTINMIRIVPTQAIELGTFEYVKRSMKTAQEKWKDDGCPKIQLGNMKIELPLHLLSPVAIAGAAAGIAGTLMCHPLEVIKVC
jgi:solute carrier family 25 phosphate transporter 23/24/25/41